MGIFQLLIPFELWKKVKNKNVTVLVTFFCTFVYEGHCREDA
jgi:hypothetical protein